MADRFYGYQYDTNPRKIKNDNGLYYSRYSKNKEPVKATNNNYYNDLDTVDSSIIENQEKSLLRNSYKHRNKQVSSDNVNINEDFSEKKSKTSVKSRLKVVTFIFAAFSILFTVSYQNSLIGESCNKKEQYKKELESLAKTNQQIEVGIENSLNLNNVESVAREKLGMQKLSNEQKIYVNLPKEDYVSPASEQIVVEENENFFVKLFKGFTSGIK